MEKFYQILLAQLISLIAFFAFPVIRYLLLKHRARTAGQPELWYLPAYGFRLVIRNLPEKHNLADIKYRVFSRSIVPKSKGASPNTLLDRTLVRTDDFFLRGGYDQILIAFKIENDSEGNMWFVHTDKVSNEIARVSFSEFDLVIADYTATLVNRLGYYVKLSRRDQLRKSFLDETGKDAESHKTEKEYEVPEADVIPFG